jgi:hypothetical protein
MITLRKATVTSLLAPLMIVMTIAFLGNGPATNFGDPLAGLNASQVTRFQAGVTEFNSVQRITPDGLGPVYNDVSCAACHTDPATGGGSSTRFVTRFGRVSNGGFDPLSNRPGITSRFPISHGLGNGPVVPLGK